MQDQRARSISPRLTRRTLSGASLGGLVPRRTAFTTGMYDSSFPAATERSMMPPRLISPRPTNSAGKSSRSRKMSSNGSTYFGVAMLPSRMISPASFKLSARNRQSRSRGVRYLSLAGSMSFPANSRSRSTDITVSGLSNPAEVVMTNDPDRSAGGREKAPAYASFPRKYRPLIKLNNSPNGAPPSRRRHANSDWPFAFRTYPARTPARLAGERRKIRCFADHSELNVSLQVRDSQLRNLGSSIRFCHPERSRIADFRQFCVVESLPRAKPRGTLRSALAFLKQSCSSRSAPHNRHSS